MKKEYNILLVLIIATVTLHQAYKIYQDRQKSGVFDYNPSIDRQGCIEIFFEDFFWLTEGYKKEEYDFGKQLDTQISKRYGKDMHFDIKVARYKGQPVGFITLLHEKPQQGTILLLCIKKEFRRLGFGKKLVEAALDFFRSLNYKVVKLDVRKNNIQAQNLYKKLGFHEVAEYQDSLTCMFACTL